MALHIIWWNWRHSPPYPDWKIQCLKIIAAQSVSNFQKWKACAKRFRNSNFLPKHPPTSFPGLFPFLGTRLNTPSLVPRRSLLAHTTWREISWRHRIFVDFTPFRTKSSRVSERRKAGYWAEASLVFDTVANLLNTQRVWPRGCLSALIFLGQTHFPTIGSQAPFIHVRFLSEHLFSEMRPALTTSENC